jgi:hypothetical protein
LKPWERQWAKPAAAPQTGGGAKKPWERQWGNAGASPQESAETIQEMHPAFSKTDRFILKTFGNDEDAAVKSLRAKHPGLDIQKDDLTGQIKVKRPIGS